jgi:hypothetical protein
MPISHPQHHKPIRQQAAEQARGNKPANPSQLGDPIDLKAETNEGPDPVETPWYGSDAGPKWGPKGPVTVEMGWGVGGGPPGVFRKGIKGAKL